ncbi:MAG: hypothetical protein ACM3US_06150 [Sphingomonadaceae bacterium]
MIVFVLLRVFLIMALWLLIFLTVFLGFLTVPLLILGVFLAAYAAFDLYEWDRKRPRR